MAKSLILTAVIAAPALLPWGIGLGPALAASFSCAKAATVAERSICADPALSALDDQLATQFNAALALSLDPTSLRTEQADWLQHERSYAAGNGTLATAYADRIKLLAGDIAQWRQRLPALLETETLAKTTCLAALADTDAKESCKPDSFESLGTVGSAAVFAASYIYTPADDAGLAYTRMVIFQQLPSGLLQAVRAPDPDPAFIYDKPSLLRSGDRTLLHVPAVEDGTGNFNREHLYIWQDGAWSDADTTSWLASLARRLPKGIGAEQGIFPDYSTLEASTPLWQIATDGDACPSAGTADLTFGWQGNTIMLKSIKRQPAAGDCGDSSSN